jgi:hypothetical protein
LMAVFAIARREQFCRDAVIEFDRHHGLKPRSDYDQQTRPLDARSFRQAYGGRIAIDRKDVATAERRNTAPIAATNGTGSPETRALAKRGLRNLRPLKSVHVSAQVIYTMPAQEAHSIHSLPAAAFRRAWLRVLPMCRLVIRRIPCHIPSAVRGSSSTDAARDTRPQLTFVRASIILTWRSSHIPGRHLGVTT